MNSVKIVVLENLEVDRRALLSLQHVFVFSVHFFERFPF